MFTWISKRRFVKVLSRAREEFKKKNYQAASELFDKALAITTAFPFHFLERGWSYFHLGRFEDAMRDAVAYLHCGKTLRNDHIGGAWNLRAQALYAMDRTAEGLADINKALIANPHPNYFFVRAHGYLASGERAKATADVVNWAELSPQNQEASHIAARWLCCSPSAEERDGAKALFFAQRACALSFWKDWAALSILAAAHAECGDFEQAIHWAEQALEVAPENEKQTRRERIEQYRQGLPFRDQVMLVLPGLLAVPHQEEMDEQIGK